MRIDLKRLFGAAACAAFLAGPAAAQQPTPVPGLPAVSGDVDDRAATDRAQRRASQAAAGEAMQGQNPYANSPLTPVFQPTFVGSGANTQLLAPGAAAPIPVAPPPAAAPPAPPPCVPGANRTC
jgi:hypothetical protein